MCVREGSVFHGVFLSIIVPLLPNIVSIPIHSNHINIEQLA